METPPPGIEAVTPGWNPRPLTIAETVRPRFQLDGVRESIITFDSTAGGVTVTENEAVAEFPLESEAERRTVVVPTGKREPEGGAAVTVTGPSTRSLACGRGKLTVAPVAELACRVRFAGIPVKTGGVVSTTCRSRGGEEALAPRLSVTVSTREWEPSPRVTVAFGCVVRSCPWLNQA
jgi:hypothetical protein